MTIQKAQDFADAYIRLKLGNEWRFTWTMHTHYFGSTQFGRKLIVLSMPYVTLNNEAEVLETLRHEVAHALVGLPFIRTELYDAHGDQWQTVCKQLGGRAEKFISNRVIRPVDKRVA